MYSVFIYDYSLLLQQNALYCTERCLAFQCDLTKDDLQATIQVETVDVATLIFVLSAIHPEKMQKALEQIFKVLLFTFWKTGTLSQCINMSFKTSKLITDGDISCVFGSFSFFAFSSNFCFLNKLTGIKTRRYCPLQGLWTV